MQLTFNKAERNVSAATSLADLRCGEQGILEEMDLPIEMGLRLMELGFLPGATIAVAGCAPGGDPRIFRVDGSEIALRKETACLMRISEPGPELP